MNKKQTTMLLTALFTLGSTVPVMASSVTDTTASMPTFSYSNTNNLSFSNEKVFQDLTERKSMLENTILADTFKELSLGEKMVLVEDYFTVRADLHKERQKMVLSATDILELERLQVNLTQESDNQNKDSVLIYQLVQEIKTKDMSSLKANEIKATKNITEKMMISYKDMRTAGRNLDTLINTQIKLVHSSQLRVLNKFGQKFDVAGDKLQALELSKKILKMTDGDMVAFERVSNLLTAENKSYFFVDNEVIEVSVPLLTKNGGAYADISDVSKVKGFVITNEEKKLTVKNGENVIEVNKGDQSASFNGTPIGKNFTVFENGKLYLPIHSTFELFHYDVKWNKEISSIVINKQVYEENELDFVSVEDMTKGLFTDIPEEEKDAKKVENEKKAPKDQETKQVEKS